MAREVNLATRLTDRNGDREAATFPVRLRPLYWSESYRFHPVGQRKAVVREDTGETLAVVSDRYTLIPHARLLDTVQDAIAGLEVGEVPRGLYVDRGGARLRALYKFPGLARPAVRDDEICPCVKLLNSYDRSARIRVEIGAFRFVCTNLAVGGGGAFAGGFVSLHQGEIPVDEVATQLRNYLTGFEKIAALYGHWARWPLDRTALEEMLEPFADYVAEGIHERWQRPEVRTVYDAYNRATRFATRKTRSVNTAFDLMKAINRGFQARFPAPDPNANGQGQAALGLFSCASGGSGCRIRRLLLAKAGNFDTLTFRLCQL